jgi:hypothetical protein
MSVVYRLVLVGEPPVDEVAAILVADIADQPRRVDDSSYLKANLSDKYGLWIDLVARSNGYYEADTDDDQILELELVSAVDIDFTMDKEDIVGKGIPSMLAMVASVLRNSSEDVIFLDAGGWLLLTRTDGVIRKYHRNSWWDHYGFANDIISDDIKAG